MRYPGALRALPEGNEHRAEYTTRSQRFIIGMSRPGQAMKYKNLASFKPVWLCLVGLVTQAVHLYDKEFPGERLDSIAKHV